MPNPAPRTAILKAQLDLTPFGGMCRLADLDGDGQLELLTLQFAGQLAAEIHRGRTDLGLDDVDRALYCLTALRLDGTILWQHGTPYDRPEKPFVSHGGKSMLLVDDVNHDGRMEILTVRHQDLVVLDAATGRELAAARLPADNFSQLTTAQLGPVANGKQIIAKPNARSYPPWQYANPVVVYDTDLSVYHEPFEVAGAGHNVVAKDFDGDGRDELLIGYSMFDHDLRELWAIGFGPEFDYQVEHADQIAVADIDGDGELEIRYAGSDDFIIADLQGNVLKTVPAGHSQNTIQGPWGPDGEERIIMNEKNLGLHGISPDGEVLWTRRDINGYARHNVRWHRNGRCWAIFQPGFKPSDDIPYQSDPADSRKLWPSFIDGDGNLYEVFPWDAGYAIPARSIRCRRSYDCGQLYPSLVADLDNDGLDEILIHNRDKLWVFASPDA